jgi:WD40 repeat protein
VLNVPSNITALATLPDLYNPLASGSHNGTIKIWNLDKKSCQRTLRGHTQPVTALVGLSSGHIVSAAGDAVKIWSLEKGVCLKTLGRLERDEINSNKAHFIPMEDSATISERIFNPVVSLIPISNDRVDEVSTKNISKLVINKGKLAMRIHYHTETDDIRSAVLADDNMLIATTKPCLKILNSLHGKPVGNIKLEHTPTCLAYRDGTAFVGHSNGYVTVIDMLTKTCIQKFHAHFKDFISSLEIERDYRISNVIPIEDNSIIVCCERGCMHSFNKKVDS